jgi:N-glycosylase/DNA lyase
VGPGVETALRGSAFGYRAKFIVGSAKALLEKGGEGWVESLKGMSHSQARNELQGLPGIGRKVSQWGQIKGQRL